FPRLGCRVQPRKGMLVAFPSDHRYEHAAEPTESGRRYALVSWAALRGTARSRTQLPYSAVIVRAG
ncbi:MAG: 2OG-Fe(II) oxygenase, partial [Myxococcales bacterium]|nr:2OG-Fe(II) oxygenase [Myxococcales bacterium]